MTTLEAAMQVYTGFDQPDIEVMVEGQWCAGELRAWSRDPHGHWQGTVQYRRQGLTYLARFPADVIRRDTVDRTHGRG